MNSYEDFCGMSTLGALNLGGKADSDESVLEGKSVETINQQALFKCMDVALKKTKEITKLMRDRWDQKD